MKGKQREYNTNWFVLRRQWETLSSSSQWESTGRPAMLWCSVWSTFRWNTRRWFCIIIFYLALITALLTLRTIAFSIKTTKKIWCRIYANFSQYAIPPKLHIFSNNKRCSTNNDAYAYVFPVIQSEYYVDIRDGVLASSAEKKTPRAYFTADWQWRIAVKDLFTYALRWMNQFNWCGRAVWSSFSSMGDMRYQYVTW